MFILLAFFVSTSGIAGTAVAEFNTQEACEAARSVVLAHVPAPNKVVVCVAK